MARHDPQINLRQAPDRYAILEAAAFVLGKGTPGKLVQELVAEAIDSYASLESVKKALEARREQVATDEGKLAHMGSSARVQKSSMGTPS